MRLYALFNADGSLFEDVTNDMRTTELWSISGVVFKDKALAEKAAEDANRYSPGTSVRPLFELLDNPISHKHRHQQLHSALDELLVDYMIHHPNMFPLTQGMTIKALLEWSKEQTENPTPITDARQMLRDRSES